MNILIVDDKPENRYLLETLLKGKGYKVISAANGEAALEKLRTESVDLIISDILMPVMDGFQLCRACKGDPALKEIPFVFYTATYVDDKDEAFALDLGADRFIRKPLEPDAFLKAVQEALEDAERGGIPPRKPVEREAEETFKLYSERLVRKLEKKMQDLETTRDRLNHIFSSSPAVIYASQPSGDFAAIFISPNVTELLGYAPTDFTDTPGFWADHIHPEDRPRVFEELSRLFTQDRYAYEYRFRHKDGAYRSMHDAMRLVRDPSGAPLEIICCWTDVTERRQMEEALSMYEERFEKTFRSSPMAMVVSSFKEGRILDANPAFLKMHALEGEEAIGRTGIELGLWDDPGERDRIAARLKAAGWLVNIERVFRKKSGESGAWLYSVELIEVQGEPCALILINDITELKKAEQLVKDSEARYRNIVEISPVAIAVHMEGKVVFCNRAAFDLFGAESPEDLLGRPIHEIVHPDNLEAARQRIQRMMAGEKGLYPVEDRYVSLDGQIIDVEVMATPLAYEGRPALQVIVQDVTEKKKMLREINERRQEYQDIFENIIDIFYRTDNDGKIVILSPSVKEIFGYSPDEVRGKPLSGLYLHPEQREEFLAALREKGRMEGYEAEMIRKDGSVIWISTNAGVYRDENGNILGVQGVARDITAFKRVEKERQELERHLQHAQKLEAVGTLAGGIAHDFNNILSSVIGYAELSLGTLPAGSDAAEDIAQVLKAATRARDLVRHILAFSRQTEQERIPMEPHLVVKEVMGLIRSTLPATIEIRQDTAPAGAILGDPTQIHQVVMNLCTNAYHAMRDKGGVLDVRVKRVTVDAGTQDAPPDLPAGAYVRIRISDTGCGMSPKVLERIFDPYFTTKAEGEGTGLGLAVVHGIVKGHQGSIDVHSEPGKGSLFHVYLPVIEGEAEADEGLSDEPLPRGAERVLFVDDDPAIANLGKIMLEQLGYKVSVRSNGIDALKLFRSDPERFDLVMTDMTMPVMTGEGLSLEIMRIRPNIPVILCTGFSHAMDRKKALALGIREFLMKPLVRRDVATTVRRVLDQRD